MNIKKTIKIERKNLNELASLDCVEKATVKAIKSPYVSRKNTPMAAGHYTKANTSSSTTAASTRDTEKKPSCDSSIHLKHYDNSINFHRRDGIVVPRRRMCSHAIPRMV